MDNLLFDIRSLDKIVKRAMVIPHRCPSSLLLGYAWKSRSGSRGIPARFAVESTLGLLWNPCSVCRGISVRFGVEYAVQDWGAYLGDNTMSTTILDRLMHHCHLLEFDGRSYRLKEAAETLARKSKTS